MTQNSNDLSDPIESSSLSSHKLSSSAPTHHDSADDTKRLKRDTSLSKSQHLTPIHDYHSALKKQSNNNNSNGTNTTGGANNHSSKRRSTWRNLLSPSYKSRSDEFHKLFCDKIPKNERLIADYACALHREILIQGRIYISINYIAFYSNLFSWITKLVVRLRDISEICKANTARIIPNAIQIVTKTGEKHVFASFVARDKSYVMILRIWQNNLLKERMTDQEIRNLVHFGYGKDLGMSDNEELNINSPDPKTPANVPPASSSNDTTTMDNQGGAIRRHGRVDGNNNKNLNNKHQEHESSGIMALEVSENEEEEESKQQGAVDGDQLQAGHTRYNSLDYRVRAGDSDANEVMSKLVTKLHDLSDSYNESNNGNPFYNDNKNETSSPAASSAVVVDTPELSASSGDHNDKGGRHSISLHGIDDDDELDKIDHEPDSRKNKDNGKDDLSATTAATINNNGNWRSLATMSSSETKVPISIEEEQVVGGETLDTMPKQVNQSGHIDKELGTHCGCDKHQGQLIADQEFDINVDTLFSLIFTNSKFMRAHMIRRGVTDTNISNWKRSSANGSSSGDRSNSSTLSSEGCQQGASGSGGGALVTLVSSSTPKLVRSKQVRQLNYSMNINHMWAKQVQIEEKQNICRARSGVYVLKSESINSGIPYGETFTVDLTYCLTRGDNVNKSRMLVHGLINFHKDKQNWKLAMVKSLIEKQSLQGVNDFINDLTNCIKEYINKKRNKGFDINEDEQQETGGGSNSGRRVSKSYRNKRTPMSKGSNRSSRGSLNATAAGGVAPMATASGANVVVVGGGGPQRHASKHTAGGGSLARAKSKLKERKLRNIYKYYIHDEQYNSNNDNDGDIETQQECWNKFDVDDSELSDTGSDILSSIVGDIDDNGSMMMMMTSHDTDSQVASSAAELSLSGRSNSDFEDDQEEDDDEAEWDEAYGDGYRDGDGDGEENEDTGASNGNESGPNGHQYDNGGAAGRRRRYRASRSLEWRRSRQRRSSCNSDSANSNVTLNNGNIAKGKPRLCREQRHLSAAAGVSGGAKGRLGAGLRKPSGRRLATGGGARAAGQTTGGVGEPLVAACARHQAKIEVPRGGHARPAGQQRQRRRTRAPGVWRRLATLLAGLHLDRVGSAKSVGGPGVAALLALVLVVLVLHAVILGRLDAIESQLRAGCAQVGAWGNASSGQARAG